MKSLAYFLCIASYLLVIAQQANTPQDLCEMGQFVQANKMFNEKLERSFSKELFFDKCDCISNSYLASTLIDEIKSVLNTQTSLTPKELQRLYNSLGNIYLKTAEYDSAKFSFEKSATYIQNYQSEESAKNLVNQGLTHWQIGNDEKAHQLIEQALTIRESLKNTVDIAGTLNDLGLVYNESNPQKALQYYNDAADLLKPISKEKYYTTLNNIAIIKYRLQENQKALNLFKEVEKEWLSIYPENDQHLAHIKTNIAKVLSQNGEYDLALVYFIEAQSILTLSVGEQHPDISAILNQIANLHLANQKFKQAQASIEKALIANMYEDSSSFRNTKLAIASLRQKAKIHTEKYAKKSLKFNDLKTAHSSLDRAHILAQEYRHTLTNGIDKIELGIIIKEIYEELISLSLTMADVSFGKKKLYKEQAFLYSEKSKSAVLSESMQEAKAKKFSGIPDQLLSFEDSLISHINALENQLLNERVSELTVNLRKNLIQTQERYSDFISNLEKDYPKYYSLKYKIDAPNVDRIQMALHEDETLISYFIGSLTKTLFIFTITKKSYEVYTKPLPDDLDRTITGLRNGILFKADDFFIPLSKTLYTLLIPQKEIKVSGKIRIIADQRLSIIPFETLLNPDNQFLIEEHEISYFSSALLYLEREKESLDITKLTNYLLAPIDFKYESERLPSLRGTESEVKAIATIMNKNTSVFTHDEASEAEISRISNINTNKGILHLATHGVVNEKTPSLSKVYLSPTSNSDGMFYTNEIYQTVLDFDLITLSACETGLGKISKGEGVIGLSRALLYAGANNLIVSFWKVNDRSTSTFMTDFYSQCFEQKLSYSAALRQAKLNMISSDDFKAPYYWAPFVLIGY